MLYKDDSAVLGGGIYTIKEVSVKLGLSQRLRLLSLTGLFTASTGESRQITDEDIIMAKKCTATKNCNSYT